MILYIILIIIVIYAFLGNRNDIGCSNKPGQVSNACDGKNNVQGYLANTTKSTAEIIISTEQMVTRYINRVFWRSSFLFSVAIVLILYLVFCLNCASTEVKIFLGIFVSTGIIYFMQNFYAYHIGNAVSEGLKTNLDVLGSRTVS